MAPGFRRTLRATLLLAAAVLAFSRAKAVSIVPTDTWVPDELVLTNFNNTGLDWVYAGPFAPGAVGGPQVQGPEYRAVEGWRHATDEEWALRPSWTDFILPGYTEDDVLAGVTHDNYRFAFAYWSLWDTLQVADLKEAAQGWFYRNYDGHPAPFLTASGETWYVRTSPTPVPEEAAVAALVAGAFALLASGRRLGRPSRIRCGG